MVSTLTSVPSDGLKRVALGAIGTNRQRNAARMSCALTAWLGPRQNAPGSCTQGPVGLPVALIGRRYSQYRSWPCPPHEFAVPHGSFAPPGLFVGQVSTKRYS